MWSNLIVALCVLVVILYGLIGYLTFWLRSRTRELVVIAHNLESAALRDVNRSYGAAPVVEVVADAQ